MITIQQINQELLSLSLDAQTMGMKARLSDKKSLSTYKKIEDRVVFLNKVRLYLESQPREDYLKKKLQEYQSVIDRIDKEAQDRFNNLVLQYGGGLHNKKSFISKYKKEQGVSSLVQKIKIIEFILC